MLINSSIYTVHNLPQFQDKNLCCRRRDALFRQNLVKCTNKVVQQIHRKIEVMELEGYSWPSCSKQSRLVDCPIVFSKLDRRRWRRVLLTTLSTCRGEIVSSKSEVWDRVLELSSVIFGDTQISLQHEVCDRWKEASMSKTNSIRPVVSTQYWLVTDRQMDTRRPR